jgi:hypothetical protein
MTSGETNITNQQTNALNTQGNMINTVSGQLSNNQNILQMISGLFNQDGTINQNALTQLQQQSQASTQTAGQAGQAQLAGMAGTQGAENATSSAYTNALQNGAPANQQIAYQQNQNFLQMQQQAAQQGITINGTSWANAVSDSSAGQKLLQNMQQNNNIQNQNYNLGYVGQLAGNMGQLQNTAASQSATGQSLGNYATQTPLNYLQSSITNGPSALSPLLSSYQQNLSSAYQPQYMQQIGSYQQQMAQAQANYQASLNQYTGFNTMLGTYLSPLASMGGYAAMSGIGSMGGSGAAAGGAGAAGGGSSMAMAGALA